MQTWNGVLAAPLLITLIASSCATVSPPVVEEEEVEPEKKDSIEEWLELQDVDLYRPWRTADQ